MTDWFRSRPKLNIFLGILSALIILVFVMAHKPYSLREIFTPDPADSYEEAIARIENIQAAEAEIPDISPECGSIVMTHEEKVENVIVFLHGFTSCPDQFAALGEKYFDQGYNVLIPRQPRHGLQEFDGTPLKELSAEEMGLALRSLISPWGWGSVWSSSVSQAVERLPPGWRRSARISTWLSRSHLSWGSDLFRRH